MLEHDPHKQELSGWTRVVHAAILCQSPSSDTYGYPRGLAAPRQNMAMLSQLLLEICTRALLLSGASNPTVLTIDATPWFS